MRPRLHTISLTSEDPDARVEVRLELPGRDPLQGRARGATSELGHARAAAEATLQALGELLSDTRLSLDEVVLHEGAEGRWVTVLVTVLGRAGVERLVGSALVEGGVHRAAVHATLQACNRRLGHASELDAAPSEVVPEAWRDPLTVLVGTLRLLRRHVDELDSADHMAMLDRSVAAADRLADTLAGRGRTSPATTSPPVVDLGATLAGAVTAVADDDEVRVDCPTDLRVVAAPTDLHRMVVGGISAVLQHGVPPVEVEAQADGPWVHVAVRGAGDAPPAAERDLHGMRAGRTPELGLEVVRLLAEANGGAAAVEADGTHVHAVRLRLPAG